MKGIVVILFIVVISSCAGLQHPAARSELTIEHRRLNKLIVDRKPDYGIDKQDGCVVLRAISMDITELKKGRLISGKVVDAKTREPLISAEIKLIVEQNQITEVLETYTNANGVFQLKYQGELRKIEASYIAYKSLMVDLEKL